MLPFAFLKLVKRSAPFVCFQCRSQLPDFLPLMLALLMLVKEDVSLFHPQICFSASLSFALMMLVKRLDPFVCSQRRSRLPCSLSLLCAFLMVVKESVSLFRPQICCSAVLLSPVTVVYIVETGERCIAPLLPSVLLTTLFSFCFCYHP